MRRITPPLVLGPLADLGKGNLFGFPLHPFPPLWQSPQSKRSGVSSLPKPQTELLFYFIEDIVLNLSLYLKRDSQGECDIVVGV